MSRGYSDEFVVFPSGNHSITKLNIRHDWSHDPSCPSVSGRQHRPAEPEHGTLRCMEVENSSNASGPGHEREFDMVSVPNVTGGPPGALVNEPGKLVGFGTRVGPECSAPVAAMLNVTSALRKGLHEYRQANGYELAPMEGPVPVAVPGQSQWRPDRVAEFSEFCRCGDNLEYSGQSGDVAASHNLCFARTAHLGPDKVRVAEANELVGAVSHTPPRQLPV